MKSLGFPATFYKTNISTLMSFLYGYVCPVIYMALNAKMFYGGFMPHIFNDHQGVHATSNLRPRVDIFVMASCPIICPAKMP